MNDIPLGYERIATPFTSTAAATNLTLPSKTQQAGHYPYVKMVLIQAELANLRWRDDGTDPTSTQGFLIHSSATQPFEYRGDPNKIRLITASTGAVANVSYYG